jgi:hypothetical protein
MEILWQGANLVSAIALVFLARLLSSLIQGPVLRILVAVLTYLAVPLSTIFLGAIMLPGSTFASLVPFTNGLVALSVVSATLALAIAGPASDQREQIRNLDRARVDLLATREEALKKRASIQRNLDSQLRSIITPEVTKVISFLQAGRFSSGIVDRLVSDIHSSVETVIKPFSRKLLANTSTPIVRKHQTETPGAGQAAWKTPVDASSAIQPFAAASVMFAFLVAIYFRDHPEPGWGMLSVITSSLIIGAATAGCLQAIKFALRNNNKAHPLIVGFTLWAIQLALGLLAVAAVESLPRDLFPDTTWGLPASFYNPQEFVAIYTVILSVSGILVARRRDFLLEQKQIEGQILQEISLVNRDIWHLRRQGAIFVHGRIQSTLIATGLQLQRPHLTKEDAIPMIEKLEESLASIKNSNEESLPLDEFLASLSTLWDGVVQVNYSVSDSARGCVDSSTTIQDAVREVLRESVNNAAFHGSATSVDIRMELRPGGALRVRVKDNGSGPSEGFNNGLGSKLLDTVTMSWKLFREADATVLSADFATELSAAPSIAKLGARVRTNE